MDGLFMGTSENKIDDLGHSSMDWNSSMWESMVVSCGNDLCWMSYEFHKKSSSIASEISEIPTKHEFEGDLPIQYHLSYNIIYHYHLSSLWSFTSCNFSVVSQPSTHQPMGIWGLNLAEHRWNSSQGLPLYDGNIWYLLPKYGIW